MLDPRFSTEYHVRVLELAIRDSSYALVYNDTLSLLEISAHKEGSSPRVIRKVIRELFSKIPTPYSVLGRLLALIEMRMQERRPLLSFLPGFRERREIRGLQGLKRILLHEQRRRDRKMTRAVRAALLHAQQKSSEESPPYMGLVSSDVGGGSARESITADRGSYTIIEALMSLVDRQEGSVFMHLEVLDAFLSALSTPVEGGQHPMDRLIDLYFWSREDFQIVIASVLTCSLEELLNHSLVGAQLLTPQGKRLAHDWLRLSSHHPDEYLHIRSVLIELLRHIVAQERLRVKGSSTPEQIGVFYRIRDLHPGLWMKMMRSLLIHWLADRDDRVYLTLKRRGERGGWHAVSRWLLRFFRVK